MTTALDVAVGLVFMYLLLALLVSTLQELVAGLFALRAKQLYTAIEGMLLDPSASVQSGERSSLVRALYTNPLVSNLAQREFKTASTKALSMGDGLPSYIPSKTFALALLGVLKGTTTASQATGADRVVITARELVNPITVSKKLKETLLLFVDDIERVEKDGDLQIQALSLHIEDWFNDRMARVSGWYKRKSQAMALFFALSVSFASNASTVDVATALWRNASLRAAVVASAQAYNQGAANALAASALPIGWHQFPTFSSSFFYGTVLGCLMTALAVSLGAGFWFDALGKLLNIRSSGTRVSSQDGKVEA